jgi:hypothetical protein
MKNKNLLNISILFILLFFFQNCKKELDNGNSLNSDCNCSSETINLTNGESKKINLSGQELELKKHNGAFIFQGDILLTEEQVIRLSAENVDESDGYSNKSAVSTRIANQWSNKIIPYVINPSLPNPSRVTSAINHWQQKTNFRFVQRTTENDYVEFVPGDGCASYIGKIGGKQQIWLANSCSVGNTIHEIGHLVGLFHEHTRADRDNFVNVNWNNIQPGTENNFMSFNFTSYSGVDKGLFDFNSIMLYPSNAFSNNGQPTLVKKDGSTFSAQRSSLSTGDISGANSISSEPSLAPPTNVRMVYDGEDMLNVTWNLVPGANEYWVYTQMDYESQPKLYRVRNTNSYTRELKPHYYSGYKVWVSARKTNGSSSIAIQAVKVN